MSPELGVLLASIAITVATVATLALTHWPRGEAPRRQLGGPRELAPFERL